MLPVEHKIIEIQVPTTHFNCSAIQNTIINFTQYYTFLTAPFNQDAMMVSMPEAITQCIMSLQNYIRTLVQEFQFLTETTKKTRPIYHTIRQGLILKVSRKIIVSIVMP